MVIKLVLAALDCDSNDETKSYESVVVMLLMKIWIMIVVALVRPLVAVLGMVTLVVIVTQMVVVVSMVMFLLIIVYLTAFNS